MTRQKEKKKKSFMPCCSVEAAYIVMTAVVCALSLKMEPCTRPNFDLRANIIGPTLLIFSLYRSS